MADKYLINEQTLTNIGAAIRAKRGTEDFINPLDMPSEIMSIGLPHDVVLTSVTINPTGEEIIMIPTGDASGFGMVTVRGDPHLIPENIKKGERIYGVSGTFDAIDTSDATADPGDITSGKTAYVNGEKIVGTHVCDTSGSEQPDNPGDTDVVLNDITIEPTGEDFTVTPEDGVDGFSSVQVTGDENLVPENIVRDITIYGVTGTADTVTDTFLQEKQVTPASEEITITPDEKYSGLSKVTILGDKDLIPENIKKGVNIFGVDGELSEYDKPMYDITATPSGKEQVLSPDSNHSGFSKVTISGDDNLVAANIRKGVTIFGVTGTAEGNDSSPFVTGAIKFFGKVIDLDDVAVSEKG